MGLGDSHAALATAAAAMLALATGAPAVSANGGKTETAAIGDLLLPFDPKIWRIDEGGNHPVIAQLGDQHGELGIDVSIKDGFAHDCSTAIVRARADLFYSQAWESRAATLPRPGFDLHIATVEMGCRNWTGSPVFACTFYREKLYLFTADPAGCRNTPPRYDGTVIELLSGLRVP